MDPKLLIIAIAALVAALGYVCISPDQFGFLRLPQAFLQLGVERTVTGLALMLLGFLVALSELDAGAPPRRARAAGPFAFGEPETAPADGELVLDRAASADEASPPGKRRPDLYTGFAEDDAATVPNSDTPPPRQA